MCHTVASHVRDLPASPPSSHVTDSLLEIRCWLMGDLYKLLTPLMQEAVCKLIRVWKKRQHHVGRICQKLLLRISISGEWYCRRCTTATERSLKVPPLPHLPAGDALSSPLYFIVFLSRKERRRMEVMRRWWRRRKQLLGDLNEKRGYCNLKEDALEIAVEDAIYRPVVREITWWPRKIIPSTRILTTNNHVTFLVTSALCWLI